MLITLFKSGCGNPLQVGSASRTMAAASSGLTAETTSRSTPGAYPPLFLDPYQMPFSHRCRYGPATGPRSLAQKVPETGRRVNISMVSFAYGRAELVGRLTQYTE